MKEPIVSVVTTTFNGMEHLPACVESVLSQTFSHWEHIIVDDGSTDNTRSYLDSIDDERVRVIKLAHVGRAKALNQGIKIARSEYIAILDADDIAGSDRLKQQAQWLERNENVALLATKTAPSIEKLRTAVVSGPINERQIQGHTLMSYNPICHSSVMIRKSALLALKCYDESLAHLVDYDLWVRMAAAGYPLWLLESPLVYRRLHANQSFERRNRLTYLRDAFSLKRSAHRTLGGNLIDTVLAAISFFFGLLPLQLRRRLRKA